MYEKVEAICRYLECDSSGEGVIASLDEVEQAIAGQAGTKFEAAASPPSGRASTDSDVET
jgi:carbamate kinase